VHDYAALYRDAGLKCAILPLPEKVDGKQQKLFIAARTLPPELIELERQLQNAPATSTPPAADRWLHQLELAREHIMRVVPPGSSFILVDDAQWGEVSLGDRRAIPFLERNGVYWGPPPDDATAIRELERLRQTGATHIVFAWPSFWWLEHYTGLRQHLRRCWPCRVENEQLIIFELNTAREH
jgi:hypothetical protein